MIDLVGRLDARGVGTAGSMPATMIGRIHVFVDGDRPRGVVACDTVQGWVDCHHRDERGRFVAAAGVAVLVRLRGRVRVVIDRLDPAERRWLERTA